MTAIDLNMITRLAVLAAEQDAAQATVLSSHLREEELPDLLTLPEAAQYLRMKPKTLRNWGSLRKGPKPLRLGGRVVYRRNDIVAFRDDQAVAA